MRASGCAAGLERTDNIKVRAGGDEGGSVCQRRSRPGARPRAWYRVCTGARLPASSLAAPCALAGRPARSTALFSRSPVAGVDRGRGRTRASDCRHRAAAGRGLWQSAGCQFRRGRTALRRPLARERPTRLGGRLLRRGFGAALVHGSRRGAGLSGALRVGRGSIPAPPRGSAPGLSPTGLGNALPSAALLGGSARAGLGARLGSRPRGHRRRRGRPLGCVHVSGGIAVRA